MVRPILMAIPAAAALFLGGCADLMNRSTIAPEWFQAKALEVKGEGYPELSSVPSRRGEAKPTADAWKADKESLLKEAREIDAATATTGTPATDDEIRARAAQLRALTEKNGTTQPGAQP
jgi:hypothetical protein